MDQVIDKDDHKIGITLKYVDDSSLPNQERKIRFSSAVLYSPFKNAA